MNCLLFEKNALSCDHHSPTVTITDPIQLNHLHQILKAQVGDFLKVGELGGNLGTARLVALEKTYARLDELSLNTPPPPKLGLTVVLALPRPKVLRRLMMDMTAIGVDKIVLMNSYRTEKSYWQSPLLSRLDEFVLEGLQQGVDTIAPTIMLEKRFKPFVEDRLSAFPAPIVLAHPYGGDRIQDVPTPRTIIIGAEGGFIGYEVALIKSQDVEVVSLGERILRTEAAVNALMGYWGF
ncbi:MAG: 16S rRNA (uracil(1498)-N(3))-methyltransferase [Moraxella sp.]|nr:16S rRNA (uracil(1498)-N(3))-methyltransferase [Moraxella sp.]